MLLLTFKLGEEFTVFHQGESFRVIVNEKRGETCLVIDASQAFQFIRGSARVKRQPPPAPHLAISERVRKRLKMGREGVKT